MASYVNYGKIGTDGCDLNEQKLPNQQVEQEQLSGQDFANGIEEYYFLQLSDLQPRSLISKMCNGFALNELIYDDSGMPYNCRFLHVNPAFEKIAQLRSKDIINKTIKDVFPGTESFWVNQCGQVASTGTPAHFKNGAKLFDRYFDVTAFCPQKSKVATIFTDITERMQMQTALWESEINFRTIAENASDGILIIGGDGSHLYANPTAAKITGYAVETLQNMNIKDLVHPDEMIRTDQQLRKRKFTNAENQCYETIIITKNKAHIPIEAASSKIIWIGKPAVMVNFRGILRRKRIEEAMVRIHDDLECCLQERTTELLHTVEKLDQNQKELSRHKLELEKANKELVQTNTALSVLARNIDKKLEDVEKKNARAIGSQIMPILEEIQRDKIPEKCQTKLDVLAAYLNDLTPKMAKGHSIIISLSPMELRVAMMIKKGFTTEEIARLMYISPYTVKTHRRNIRKKLNIKNSDINLASYLKLKLGGHRIRNY